MPVFNNVLEAMGKTPLIRLNKLTTLADAEILVKFEALNVGGSIKTRTAYAMIEAAEKDGLLKPDSIIVEPTSGNQGIGLALVGAVKGYHVVIVMPDSVSAERRMLVEQYGAEVILVEDKGNIGEAIDRCAKMAEDLKKGNPKVYIPQQFENPNNPKVQREVTAREILNDVDGPIDGYCSGVGTGGTLSGIGEVLKEANPNILIWAVEPQNAAILAGGSIKTHLQMGIGDGLIPKNLNTSIFSSSCIVSDEDALYTAKQLALKEGLLCGISSGSNVYAALKMARELGPGKRVVTILPDTGERYFSTPLFRHHLS
ncbi:cysteine synthase A [bacterium]|nr:cysteine synthase A [bacterium]